MLELFQGINDDKIRGTARIETFIDTHHSRDLTSRDADGRSSHECSDRSERDQINDPPHSKEADCHNDSSAEYSQGGGNNMPWDAIVDALRFENDISDNR